MTVVEVRSAADIPAASNPRQPAELAEATIAPTDLIGPGDVLDINIYEAGVTLFAGGSGAAAMPGQALLAGTPGVQVQKLPPSRVNDAGDISIPYAGTLHVQGRTVTDVQLMIQRALRRLSQNPQVLVTIAQPLTNTVIVGGEVARPGRMLLQTNRETLTDVVALAGGYRGNARDLALRVTRGGNTVDYRLEDLIDNPALDVRAAPGDRFMLVSAPRSFSVLGASGRVQQLPFPRSSVTLAEAIATAGGVDVNYGDPAALFLFRYARDGKGEEAPVIYHLNMMTAGSYFLAQKFTMRDGDVLYFGNAAANQPARMFQLISQLFTPLVTVTAAAQTLKN